MSLLREKTVWKYGAVVCLCVLSGCVGETAPPRDSSQLADDVVPSSAADASADLAPEQPALSNETDFDAVSNARTIEDDAARVAANRARYTLVLPQDLPQRPDTLEPNIIAYALATTNPVGVPLYSRLGVDPLNRHERNCAAFVSPDLAQIAFLQDGGPARDWQALDPDGDGFACAWDPTPFRRIAER